MTPTSKIPEFVVICGAVGSGNTFLFKCLTQDPNTFGVNEDALGFLLNRWLRSANKHETCPHCFDALRDFVYSLRRDRRTLILKSPSNLRYISAIKDFLNNSGFIIMIREPHAAIVSGLSRHKAGVEKVARTWLSDCKLLEQHAENALVVDYNGLVRNPVTTLEKIQSRILPLSSPVFEYAEKTADRKKSAAERWRGLIDDKNQEKVVRWVERLDLIPKYHRILKEYVGN